jgi:TonB family protein
VVEFILRADGHLDSLAIRRSSGDEDLDRAALAAVRDAAPCPPPGVDVLVVIPVSFQAGRVTLARIMLVVVVRLALGLRQGEAGGAGGHDGAASPEGITAVLSFSSRPHLQDLPALAGGQASFTSRYRSVTTWDSGTPIIVPSRPYPSIVVPVMQVFIIIPAAVQSA